MKLNQLGNLPKMEDVAADVNGVVITVHKRLPYEEVLAALQWCIDYIITDHQYVSEPIKRIVRDFAVARFFTNLEIGEFATVGDFYAEYDLLDYYKVIPKVEPLIDSAQLAFFDETLNKTLDAIIAYRTSAAGIVDTLSDSAKQDSDNMQAALDSLNNGQARQLLEIIDKVSEIKGEGG